MAPSTTNISGSRVLSPFWIFPLKHPQAGSVVLPESINVLLELDRDGVGWIAW